MDDSSILKYIDIYVRNVWHSDTLKEMSEDDFNSWGFM